MKLHLNTKPTKPSIKTLPTISKKDFVDIVESTNTFNNKSLSVQTNAEKFASEFHLLHPTIKKQVSKVVRENLKSGKPLNFVNETIDGTVCFCLK